jgi:5-formyltetrahydrofolate cyclo-ligase
MRNGRNPPINIPNPPVVTDLTRIRDPLPRRSSCNTIYSMPTTEEMIRQKQTLRQIARARRKVLPNKDELSEQICRKLADLPQFAAAATIMFYVDSGSEVRTRHFFPFVRAAGKDILVPFCEGDELELFRLQDIEELTPGTLGILEPSAHLRDRGERRARADQLDLIVVPGLAFDHNCGRLGQGKGFYDRFLPRVGSETTKVALAFECQIFSEVPMLPGDVYMDIIITEEAVYKK